MLEPVYVGKYSQVGIIVVGLGQHDIQHIKIMI